MLSQNNLKHIKFAFILYLFLCYPLPFDEFEDVFASPLPLKGSIDVVVIGAVVSIVSTHSLGAVQNKTLCH